MNRSDCKQVLKGFIEEGTKVDLIYLDPPFNSNRSYNIIYDRLGYTKDQSKQRDRLGYTKDQNKQRDRLGYTKDQNKQRDRLGYTKDQNKQRDRLGYTKDQNKQRDRLGYTKDQNKQRDRLGYTKDQNKQRDRLGYTKDQNKQRDRLGYTKDQSKQRDRLGYTKDQNKQRDRLGYTKDQNKQRDRWEKLVFSVKTGKECTPAWGSELSGTMTTQSAEMGVLILDREPTQGMQEVADNLATLRYHPRESNPSDYFPCLQIITTDDIFDGRRLLRPPSMKELMLHRQDAQTDFS